MRHETYHPLIGRIALVIAVCVSGLSLFAYLERTWQSQDLGRQIQKAQDENKRIISNNVAYATAITNAKSDDAVEAAARQKFGLGKPGDTSFIIITATPTSLPVTATPRPAPPGAKGTPTPAPTKRPSWLDMFKGLLGSG